jgi:hypothetical protein
MLPVDDTKTAERLCRTVEDKNADEFCPKNLLFFHKAYKEEVTAESRALPTLEYLVWRF